MDSKQTPEEEKLNPGHTQVRGLLRFVGPALLCVGLLFMAIGLIDFFSAFGGSGPPTKFWCFFVGMPFTFFGLSITNMAYMGAFFRYVSAENAPVAKDSFNYMAAGTKEGVRDIASAVREGIVGQAADEVRCASCNQTNDCGAKFCDACGVAMSSEKDCSDCEAPNDLDAKFCDFCGSPF